MRTFLKKLILCVVAVSPFTGFAEKINICKKTQALSTDGKIVTFEDRIKTLKEHFSDEYTLELSSNPTKTKQMNVHDLKLGAAALSTVHCNNDGTVTVFEKQWKLSETETSLNEFTVVKKIRNIDLSPNRKIKKMYLDYYGVFGNENSRLYNLNQLSQ